MSTLLQVPSAEELPLPVPCTARPATHRFPVWILFGALLLASLYLPTLRTRFDFIDDGNLVYPSPPMPLGKRLLLVWEKIVGNYRHLGPFRPVLWAHWETEAELFRANPVAWRAARMAWAGLAAAVLLWLLRELGARPGALLLAGALALWEPYRSEIWTSLTLSEGVAMPYALLALVCAVRAARSPRPWKWDLLGPVALLMALGCKNTFAAVLPAQLLLRLLADGSSLRNGWRRHGRAACLLLWPLLLPMTHFILFKLQWHPGQYSASLSAAQLGRLARMVTGALSPWFVGPGLLLAVLVVVWHQRTACAPQVWQRHRLACLAGLALLLCGTAVYAPLDIVSGRYAMPAVWGADVLIAVLLSELAEVRWPGWRRAAFAAFGCGLAAVAVANVGKQEKFAARADVLWQTLERVAQEAPPGACIAWQSGPDLNAQEAVHFLWHLQARGRADLALCVLDEEGRRLTHSGASPVPTAEGEPSFLVSGLVTNLRSTPASGAGAGREPTPGLVTNLRSTPASGVGAGREPTPGLVTNLRSTPASGVGAGRWQHRADFRTWYWAGRRHYDCHLWAALPPPR
jgi:hypothetical protein